MKTLFVIIFSIISISSFSQTDSLELTKWRTFEEVGEFFLKRQAPILIYLYTDDCSSCQIMLDSTFQNSEVANYVNALFYPIKLNANTNDTLTFFNGEKFARPINSEYHSLVSMLLADSIRFPSLVIFDEQAQGQAFYGKQNRDSIFPKLIYYAEKIHKSTTYEEFEKNYFEAYPPGQKQIMTHLKINWIPFDEMKEKQKVEPRKVLIDIYFNYSISATMMRTHTYNNSIIAAYLNKNYYCTTVNAKSTDEISLLDVTYTNSGAAHGYHDFAIAVLQAKMEFPAFIILDENYQLLERVQLYLTPEKIEPIFQFYGSNKYKEISYKKYSKSFKGSFSEK